MNPYEDYVAYLRSHVGHQPILVPHSIVIVLNQKRQILVEVRGDDGELDLPGGGVELKETFEEAAKREVLEETGLIIDDVRFFDYFSGDITHHIYPNGDEIYGVDVVFWTMHFQGEIKPAKPEIKDAYFEDADKIVFRSERNQKILKRAKQMMRPLWLD